LATGVPKGDTKMDLYPQKLPKLDFTTDAEYVANFVDANMWL